MSYSEDTDDLLFEDEEEDDKKKKRRGRSERKERTVFTVFEVDANNNNIKPYACFESFGNPIPSLRYAARLNLREGRHKYFVSPRPSAAMIAAANV